MKRVISMVLCLMLVLSLATTAFAADETVTTYKYDIYQIFTGTFEEDVLTDVKWGANGTGTVGTAVAEDVLEALEAVKDATDNETKLKVILNYAKLTGEGVTAFKTVETIETTQEVEGLADGYYLVKDQANSQEGLNQSYTTYIVKVVDGKMTITRKADVPTVEKDIVEGNNKVDENNTSIGKTVNYEFTGTLPTNIADYDTYFYRFTDTLSKGLTYNNDLIVKVNGVDVTKYFYVNATAYDKTNGTTITVSIQDLLTLDNDTDANTEGVQMLEGMSAITADTTVVVTYSAVLNENAIVGVNGNPNDVDLEYSNDPNDDGDPSDNPPDENPPEPAPVKPTGKTPKSEVWTYTTDLTVIKVDEEGNSLAGAKFKLTGDGVKKVVITTEVFEEAEDGTYYKLKDGTYTETAPTADDPATDDVNEDTFAAYEDTTTKYKLVEKTEIQEKTETVQVEAFVGDDGVLKVTGLGAGEYTITEIIAPDGYNMLEAPIKVTIEWDDKTDSTNDCTWTYGGTDLEDTNKNGTYDEGEVYLAQVTIVNQKGSTLPETGGMGTTLFYVFGSVMVLAAVVLLVTKKRMGAAE